MSKQVLDVGSGIIGAVGHKFLNGAQITHADISKTAYHVEVVCDAHYLPLRDNTFSAVNVSHVLEHLENPIMALKEFKRVSNRLVVIQVPNAPYFNVIGESRGHIFSWNHTTLQQLLERVFGDVTVLKSVRKGHGWVKNMKIWLLSTLVGHHSLIAYCWKKQ